LGQRPSRIASPQRLTSHIDISYIGTLTSNGEPGVTYTLELPERLRRRGWKVKIRNLERNEQPHVTVLRKTSSWRFGLRFWIDLRVLGTCPTR
jgi:2'-5' RNA ligase